MISPKQKERVIKLYEQGFSHKRISDMTMLNYSQVSHFLTRHFQTKRHHEEFTQDEIDTLIELYNKELFYNDIAKQMGRRYGAVVYQVAKLQREGKLAKRGTSFRMKKLYYK